MGIPVIRREIAQHVSADDGRVGDGDVVVVRVLVRVAADSKTLHSALGVWNSGWGGEKLQDPVEGHQT